MTTPIESDTLEGGEVLRASWQQYANDFNAMTDAEIEAESADERQKLDEAEGWLEAVAAWEAAGKPRSTRAHTGPAS